MECRWKKTFAEVGDDKMEVLHGQAGMEIKSAGTGVVYVPVQVSTVRTSHNPTVHTTARSNSADVPSPVLHASFSETMPPATDAESRQTSDQV